MSSLPYYRSGGISYHELRDGLKKMRFTVPIRLSEADYEGMTDNGALCDEEVSRWESDDVTYI